MSEEITLKNPEEKMADDEERNFFESLEEKIVHLLRKYQELVNERNGLITELNMEREKRSQLEKKMEYLSHDREKVKGRIDQLLHRLKNIDL